MKQKVWIIPDEDWGKPTFKSRAMDARPGESPPELIRAAERPLPDKVKKSPALSFSLSMFIWGSGQIYVRDFAPGAKFMASMVFFYLGLSYLVLARSAVIRFFSEIDIPASIPAIGCAVFFATGLVAWLCNAIDAYYRTTNTRSEPFRGVSNGAWPLLCSLLFPGWGQFINGQPRKGFCFLLSGLIGVVSIFVVLIALHIWPFLKTTHERFVFEIYLVAAFLVVPLSVLMWIVSMYDAFRSNCELSKRNPGMACVGIRTHRRGALHELIPRGTAILGLLLAMSVGMQYIPKNFYQESLQSLRHEMLKKNMEIIPELIGLAADFAES
jgi:TM2 domain-containing membrane protein YozV